MLGFAPDLFYGKRTFLIILLESIEKSVILHYGISIYVLYSID